MKLCVDCKYATREVYAYGERGPWECEHPEVAKHSLVSGNLIRKKCLDARGDTGACGPSGSLFEKKPQVAGLGLPRRIGTFWSRLFGGRVGA